MTKKYRIKDIAEMSGVSAGTVDRILHRRGKVSDDAREKVETVLKEIDYHPNLIARSLALKKQYHIYTLIPSYETGEYWETLSTGIARAEQELSSYNVDVIPLYFNQYDRSSFDRLTVQLAEADCQGVIIATLFRESVMELVQSLDKREIPYVLIDAYIEGTNCLAYYGTNSYDSGYIAGRLLFEQIRPTEDIAIFRFLRKGDMYSTQVQVRESGFRTYLNEHRFEGKIHTVCIHAENREENFKILDDFFRRNPNVSAGIIFNSRAHQLCHYFEQRPWLSFKLTGYDVIKQNIRYLDSGQITHLIAQRPEVQGANAVKALFRHLVLHEATGRINYMPIDILIRENIKYYNNYI
ncbi:MAG: LacI family DNA-binding transcriptional regulator [Tannerellaceae bacterium]|jgi:LacI family transcriptional regulator|nr:LacI family DNA-binding transcriptional regulator [Tannerellaceae bacterium]